MINKPDNEREEFINITLKQYYKLKEQIEALKKTLNAYGVSIGKSKGDNLSLFDGLTSNSKIKLSPEKNTLRGQVEALLENQQIPMTSREIMEKLNLLFNKRYQFNKFSGNFSQMYRKNSSNIKKVEIDSLPLEFRAIYVLKDWLSGSGTVKEEYLKKYYKEHKL